MMPNCVTFKCSTFETGTLSDYIIDYTAFKKKIVQYQSYMIYPLKKSRISKKINVHYLNALYSTNFKFITFQNFNRTNHSQTGKASPQRKHSLGHQKILLQGHKQHGQWCDLESSSLGT